MQEQTFDKKNILVTGGAGFIGSHLCEELLRNGNKVICVDNFSTGNERNIDALLQNQDFIFLRLDINEQFNLEQFSELGPFKIPFQGIQEIYHLACPTSIKKFEEYKIQTLLSNSLGNYHILELAKKYRAKVLYSSSSVVYGKRDNNDLYESEDEIGVVDQLSERACYDEGKRFSETMFETYKQVHGIDTKIVRIFRTYGPRMPLFDGHLIPDFILNALDNKDLILNGGKDFSTSLCYITDVIDGLVRIMDAKENLGAVNLGSDVDLHIGTIAKQIIDMTDSSSKMIDGQNFAFLSELALPHIEKAKKLGWFPLIRLEDGLKRTIEYIKANKILLTNM